MVPADTPDGTVYLLLVTPAALKGLNAFQKELQARGIAPEIIRTKVGFDTDASFPKLTFAFGGFLDEQSIDAVDKLFGSDKVLAITGEKSFVAPIKASVEIPQSKPVLVKETVEETKPEPEVKTIKGFGSATPVTTTEAAPKKAAKKPVEEKAATVVSSGNALADEIADLLKGMSPDDSA